MFLILMCRRVCLIDLKDEQKLGKENGPTNITQSGK